MTDMNECIRGTLAGRQAERNNRFADRHTAHLEDQLRRRYLGAHPGGTEEAFRAALPDLIGARRRAAAVDGATDRTGSGGG